MSLFHNTLESLNRYYRPPPLPSNAWPAGSNPCGRRATLISVAQTGPIPKLSLPPGPKGKLLIGNAMDLVGHWSGYSARCARQFGGVVLYKFFHAKVVMISDPD